MDELNVPDPPELTPELQERVSRELQPNERVVWVGQPRPDLMARPAWFMVPCGIFFLVFSIFWIGMTLTMFGAIQGGPGPGGVMWMIFPCFSVPFILVGLLMLASPIWLRARARKMVYALTNHRAIIWEPAFFGSVTTRSYTASGLGHMTKRQRADGAGDLIFEEFVTYGTDSQGHRTATTTLRGFLAIDRVHDVEELIRRTLFKE
jgi:hypothetical protein